MKATQQLKSEHRAVLMMLNVLERVSDKLEKGEAVNLEHLEQILDFLKGFVDRCHHAKEEERLFPQMEKAGLPKVDGPIKVVLTEHALGRDYIRSLAEAVGRHQAGEPAAAASIADSARSYIKLLTQHIDKEDNILFMMADDHLSEAAQDELYEEFEKIEIERIGLGKHEEYHKMLETLGGVYLGHSHGHGHGHGH